MAAVIPSVPAPSLSPAFGRLARRDALVRTALVSVLWLGVLLVAYWWAAGGGFQDLGSSLTDALLSLGRLSGLVGSALLLVQVLLMARVPLLERAYGQDRLVRIHRIVGLTSFDLIVVHVVLITWGYAAGRLGSTPATFWDLTWHDPGMLLAVAGTLLLVMVVLTSLRVARRRLRYESWHLLHLYGYLGAGLALPHQLWTGQEFLASPRATYVWWAAWAAVAATVVVFRVALPLLRNYRHGLRVAAIFPEGPGVVSVHLIGRRLDRLRAEPGQYFTWRFLDREGWTRANPFSLSAAPDGRTLRITVQSDGDGSASVGALRPGQRVLVEGPYGRLTPRARTQRKVALIGAGVGLAPLRALAEGLGYAPGEAVLLQRYRSHQLFAGELGVLRERRGLNLVAMPGARRSAGSWVGEGYDGYDDAQVLLGWIPDLVQRDVYVCGPPAWTAAVRQAAEQAGLPREQWHEEAFGW
ncbi:ferredoxin reductase family protein [Nocardioides sp. BP30]|uniref:ferredoxin reductase family protein n=1 Tax=Nocardioides sp. BP30 TaxID=3036374 RepID=UPI002468C27F|nr:ferredoxin reductase family protein [Nocardioides sp. BP30]WGL51588.1 ferredoxin reductase family protein [Nocardioides sp. BP30]